jgi:hypothetical protein
LSVTEFDTLYPTTPRHLVHVSDSTMELVETYQQVAIAADS